ncbi:molybdate ABC transporter substrate-binding protein [Amaricoccus macauensis]|uniref:molybdate ABC transporter substrate-binding protein n=1 Tax=Amaricoccus macauensis TaxID=57001 RepID=UPI003C7BDB3E
MRFSGLVLAALLAIWGGRAGAGEVHVAVAANFTEPAREIASAFEELTGHETILSFGSTGQLYAQISQGAPFDVFLAADQERPRRAIAEGYAVKGTNFTYALGALVLWSADGSRASDAAALEAGDFHRLAIANPVTAPYGTAAMQVLDALGLVEELEPKLVRGNNIAQTFQFVETGNAELGFVAASQLAGRQASSGWVIDPALYDPIRQDAVLLLEGDETEAARKFLTFLQGAEAAAIIERFGYGNGTGAAVK